MVRPDNSHHLLAAARQRSEDARARVAAALQEMSKEPGPRTASELARTARVSRSWLYSQPEVMVRLEEFRTNPPPAPTGQAVHASDHSLRRRLHLAHQRIAQLTEENKQLNERLARVHGALRLATQINGQQSQEGRNSPGSRSSDQSSY
ncbi:DUF6262 family protein [Arthrobacter sp. 18067]|uniref:DUF6262 family protein n=1 Tax=Arthrobacter sp. 18067 TaxID=2681413 RepID=UPI0013579C39|nr:DUF6262 family protein [Arthrobacter sp. 18067]